MLISASVILFLAFGIGYGLNGEYGIGFNVGNMLVMAMRPLKVAVDGSDGKDVKFSSGFVIYVIEFLFYILICFLCLTWFKSPFIGIIVLLAYYSMKLDGLCIYK